MPKSLVQQYAEVKWGYRMEIDEYMRYVQEEHNESVPECLSEEHLIRSSEDYWEEL